MSEKVLKIFERESEASFKMLLKLKKKKKSPSQLISHFQLHWRFGAQIIKTDKPA